MTHGYIRPGWVNGFQEVKWQNDPLANRHNMDSLWGFMIRVGEQCWMLVLANLRDPVLWQLLKVGIRRKRLLVSFADDPIDGDLQLEVSEICSFLSIFSLRTLSSHKHSSSYTCSHLRYALTTCLSPPILFRFTIHTKSEPSRTSVKSIRTISEARSYLLMRLFARYLLPPNTVLQGFTN